MQGQAGTQRSNTCFLQGDNIADPFGEPHIHDCRSQCQGTGNMKPGPYQPHPGREAPGHSFAASMPAPNDDDKDLLVKLLQEQQGRLCDWRVSVE